MPPKNESEYHIDLLKKAKEDIALLAKKAASRGIRKDFIQAFKVVIEQLKTRPLEWGDPERKTLKKGGLVCHGVVPLLITHFVLYESERAVFIIQIQPFPGSALE